MYACPMLCIACANVDAMLGATPPTTPIHPGCIRGPNPYVWGTYLWVMCAYMSCDEILFHCPMLKEVPCKVNISGGLWVVWWLKRTVGISLIRLLLNNLLLLLPFLSYIIYSNKVGSFVLSLNVFSMLSRLPTHKLPHIFAPLVLCYSLPSTKTPLNSINVRHDFLKMILVLSLHRKWMIAQRWNVETGIGGNLALTLYQSFHNKHLAFNHNFKLQQQEWHLEITAPLLHKWPQSLAPPGYFFTSSELL